MVQKHEHLLAAQPALVNIALHDRVLALKPMLIPQALENALRRMTLLSQHLLIGSENLINDFGEAVQFRPGRRRAPPITRGRRERAHLVHRLARDAKITRRLSSAPTFNKNRLPNPQIQSHGFHAPVPSPLAKDPGLPAGSLFRRPQHPNGAASVAYFLSGAYSRADAKCFGSAMVETSNVAAIGPMPGIVAKRRLISFDRCHATILASNDEI